MRTTLVYAGITGKGFGSIGQGLDSGWIGHGLAMVSSATKACGHEVDLIDLRALSGWDHFRSELLKRQPRVLGLSMMSVDYDPVMTAIDLAKEVIPDIVTVVGGPHVSLATDDVLPNPKVDFLVVGEGEIAYPELLGRIERGEGAERVFSSAHPDLNTIPFADRRLFLDEWRRWGYKLDSPEVPIADLPTPFVTVITGRGCIYNCSFCMPAERFIFGPKVRRRSVENVIAELKQLRDEYNFQSMLIHDDCITEDRAWVQEFCRRYREEGFTAIWYCQSRADIICRHPDMIKDMYDAGLRGVFVGFESGNQRVLNFLRKGTKVEHNIEAARILRSMGIKIWANYMLGIPTETKDEVMDTIRMLKIIDPDYYSPSFFTPHPGSDLYTYCEENDLSLIKSHEEYRRNPTAPKIKGVDYEWLNWALKESQRRTVQNRVRRAWARYARPDKVKRRLTRMLTGTTVSH